MNRIFAIAGTDLKRLFRDRSALFFVLVLPVLITLIIGLATGGLGTKVRLGVVDRGSGALGAELRQTLAHSPRMRLTHYGSPSALRTAVRHQELEGGVIIPAGYDGDVRAGRHVTVLFVTNPTTTPAAVRSAVAAAVNRQSELAGAAGFTVREASVTLDRGYVVAREQAVSGGGVRVESRTSFGTAPLPQGFSYTAPSNLILFMFITSLAASAVIVNNRRLGVTRRMLASPTSATQVLLGQGLGRFATALFQGTFILLLGRVVFGVNWGDKLSAASIVLVFAVVSTGAALVVGTLARTEEQTSALGPPIGIGLGMLGGCMWPISIVPHALRVLGHIGPQAWAMDGFITIIGRGGHLGDVAPNLLALAGFAVVLVPLGAWRLRRTY
ncbi:MAG: ABC transporter permease [Actinobacteria bacterium]|nr:MAG: ABC transporter permease [Actinomycetota bacterium]